MKKSIVISLLSLVVLVASCSEDNVSPDENRVLTSTELEVNSVCQETIIRVASSENWEAVADSEWVTVISRSGKGDGEIPVYIQQNDGDEARTASIEVRFANGKNEKVSLRQLPDDSNGSLSYVPQSYGVGWGYDGAADYGDVAGLRGQIIDVAKLRQLTEWDGCVQFDNSTGSYYEVAAESSTTELCNYLSTKLTGEVDLKIAGAKVSAEFEKQVTETANRYYLWYRNYYQVKECYFMADLYDPYITPYALTLDFKKAIYSMTPAEFVKKYGTHLVTSSALGGKLDYYMTVSQDIKETVERITLTVSVKFLCWSASTTHVEEEVWTSIKQSLTGRFYCAGGGEKGRQLNELLERTVNQGVPTMPDGSRCTLFEEWAQCFSDPNAINTDDLAIVAVHVIPIADIVSMVSPAKAKALDDYIRSSYLN